MHRFTGADRPLRHGFIEDRPEPDEDLTARPAVLPPECGPLKHVPAHPAGSAALHVEVTATGTVRECADDGATGAADTDTDDVLPGGTQAQRAGPGALGRE